MYVCVRVCVCGAVVTTQIQPFPQQGPQAAGNSSKRRAKRPRKLDVGQPVTLSTLAADQTAGAQECCIITLASLFPVRILSLGSIEYLVDLCMHYMPSRSGLATASQECAANMSMALAQSVQLTCHVRINQRILER